MRCTALTPLLLLAGLSSTALAQADYTFQIDQAASQFIWSGTTSVGDIIEQPPNFSLTGTSLVQMDGGGSPVGSGAFANGGDALITPNITGTIPNPLPFLPPLAVVQLQDAHLRVASSSFAVGNLGDFSTQVTLHFIAGTLIITDALGGQTVMNLAGTQSNPTPSTGTLVWSATEYVLSAPVNSNFVFADPGSGISGSITVTGNIVARHVPLAPATYCSSLPNSSGAVAQISTSGQVSLGAGALTLNINQLPANTFGLVFLGPDQTNLTFGNGIRCVGGTLQRFTAVNTGSMGSVSQLIDNSGLPANALVSAGDTRKFQFWFRDVPAGGALFNTSDALSVTYTP